MTDLASFDRAKAEGFIEQRWADDLVPNLERYIEIPALSPAFDDDWVANGHIEAAVRLIADWMQARPVAGMMVSVERLEGRTPLIVAEIDAYGPNRGDSVAETTTVLYGHLDKQPEMMGWRDGLGPWTPVRDGDRLYGRGGGDDGYAAFASLTAIEAIQHAGGSHGRCVLLIEACEESGSPDLPAHIEALAGRLGQVGLIVCLDSGCATYDTVWLTTSLRGMVGGTLSVQIIREGLHSGSAGGIVPSTFRILRQLLDRIESAETGAVLLESANVAIPPYRIAEAEATAEALGGRPVEVVPFLDGASGVPETATEALLARTWHPSLSYTGIDGLPPTESAGNVLRPQTAVKLSLRLPPTADPEAAGRELKQRLEADPPYGAAVRFHRTESGPGWNAPDLAPWLRAALDEASMASFGQQMQLYGEGGSIPFMGMLGEQFPEAQFVVTGVLGPESNAHGPNEFLHLGYAEKLTCCLAAVLDAANRSQ